MKMKEKHFLFIPNEDIYKSEKKIVNYCFQFSLNKPIILSLYTSCEYPRNIANIPIFMPTY